MRLTAIRLAGFKSFVEPTLIPIPGNRVGIVGPNGCGKSNLIDAVRWVMGESAARHLRGDAMADVIFNGSGSRAPIAQASIELHFDNSAGRLDGPWGRYREIVVRRVLNRDGQSQYFLNDTRCRRRDVTDLFLGTGLGPRSYAIIEQGMISRLIEARPEELRTLVEEAAGVSRYRERRRETETRIAQTRDNLARLGDVREELGRQLQTLARQAQSARQFLELRERERAVAIRLAAWRWRQRHAELAGLEAERARHAAIRAGLEAEQERREAAQQQTEAARLDAARAFESLQQRQFTAGATLARLEQERDHQRAAAVRARAEREQLTARMAELARERDATAALAEQAQVRTAELGPMLAALDVQRQAAQTAQAERAAALRQRDQATEAARGAWERLRREQTGAATQVEQLQQRLAECARRLQRLQGEAAPDVAALAAAVSAAEERLKQAQMQEAAAKAVLDQARAAWSHQREVEQAARHVLDQMRGDWQRARGQLAALETLRRQHKPKAADLKIPPAATPLIERMTIAPGWERAVETVLAHWLHAQVLDDPLGQLPAKADSEGPALAWIDGAAAQRTPLPERLAGQVQGAGALESILETIQIAPDLATARARVAQLAPHESVITPEGWWLGAGWVRGGRAGAAGAEGVLLRERQWREACQAAAGLEAAANTARGEHEAALAALAAQDAARQAAEASWRSAQQAHAAARYDLERAQLAAAQAEAHVARHQREESEIGEQQATLEAALTEARAALLALDERIAATRAELDAQTRQRAAEAARRDGLAQEAAALDRRRHDLTLQLERAQGEGRAQALRLQALQAEAERLGARLAEIDSDEAARQAPLQALDAALTEARAERERIDAELTAARQRVESLDQTLQQLRLDAQSLAYRIKAEDAELEALSLRHQEARLRSEDLAGWLEVQGEDPAAAAARLDVRDTEEKLLEEGDSLARRIERMGAVNLAAVEDHAELSDRIAGLEAQHADLAEALETLEAAMRRMDHDTRALFAETFERLNTVFQTTFPKLFGGGEARLELEGDGGLLPGIRVIARPPGKRNSSIHLLSGGEKALTAVALVFAIFELNPAPFCMLDEVDAPLDEANVGRFCDLVREMAERVQCIFVTHNKTTMTAAEHLIGITMQEPGVSRMVAVDLERASALVASTAHV
ncbi:MAG: chromosome partition protein Smc [Pseudomonadota bacterium]